MTTDSRKLMARILLIFALLVAMVLPPRAAEASAEFVATPYLDQQKVVFDFYFDDPDKINSALYWLKGLVDPLMAEPYNHAPDDLDIKVILHGTELVTLAKHNYARYREAVERMRYYAELGVEFKVCAFAAQDYDYDLADFQDFVQVVPSAIAELAHWQNQGHVLITPRIQEKRFSIDEIR
jgi:intracellular sulfur oxidation DsrE/DsrF family protein